MRHLKSWMALVCGLVLFQAASCDNNQQKTTQTTADVTSDINNETTVENDQLITDKQWEDATSISYHFGDSSLPPDYHRSYTITVTAETIAFTVDCYGNTLLEKSYANTPAQFSKTKEALKRCGIGLKNKNDENVCDGGTSESFTLSNDTKDIFYAFAYNCGGESSGTLSVEKDNLSAVMAEALPESLSDLLNSTMEQDDEDDYVEEVEAP